LKIKLQRQNGTKRREDQKRKEKRREETSQRRSLKDRGLGRGVDVIPQYPVSVYLKYRVSIQLILHTDISNEVGTRRKTNNMFLIPHFNWKWWHREVSFKYF
jgi:hypothetical protein